MAIHKLLRDLRETREGILGAALLATTAMGLACHSESAIEQGNRWRVREPHRAFEITDDDITCFFKWTVNESFGSETGFIAHEGPNEEDPKLSGSDTFYDISTDRPKRKWLSEYVDSAGVQQGSTTEFDVVSRSNDRVVLFYAGNGGHAEFVTIWKKVGIAIWTKHRTRGFSEEPHSTMSMGHCVD